MPAMRGVPVLQTVIGVFLGCIMIGSLKTANFAYTIATYAFLCIAKSVFHRPMVRKRMEFRVNPSIFLLTCR